MSFISFRSSGIAISLALHSLLFLGGAAVLVQNPQYGVELGSGGIEVNLTAARQELSVESVIVPDENTPAEMIPDPDPDAMPLLKATVTPAPAAKAQSASSTDGKDSVTLYSKGGALSEAAPYYLKNPAPLYPAEARRNGWAGLVILKVGVDKSGRASSAVIEQSSGFPVLDESALKTVGKWRFRPAQLGGIAVDSQVRVPVRFELEKA